MKPYTYLIGWSALNKWYYGVRYAKGCVPEDLWVKYFTSSQLVAAFRASNGEPDVVEVRRVFYTPAAAMDWEDRVLRRTDAVRSPQWINGSNGGKTFNASSPITRAKVAEANRGKRRSDEAKAKMSEAAKHRPPQNNETRKRRSASLLGSVWTEESKAKMRKPKSDDTRRRMSEAAKRRTPEHTAAIKAAHQNRSPEYREKLRQAALRQWAHKYDITETSS